MVYFFRNKISSSINTHEIKPVIYSASYFLCLLCSYYLLRPIRDEMGIRVGVSNLSWLFSGTFIAMILVIPIFGWLTTVFSRRIFIPICYLFFTFNILFFFIAFLFFNRNLYVAASFFIWLSVFNLFIVSIFWSFMVDIFTNYQARRLFGIIAAGGSAGAIIGPALTASLAPIIGTTMLLPLSACFLAGALICIFHLLHYLPDGSEQSVKHNEDFKINAHQLLEGLTLILRSKYLIGIATFVFFYTLLSTLLYFQQAEIISETIYDSDKRTRLFAIIDLVVNILTISTQLFVFSQLIKRLSLALTLALLPMIAIFGFLILGFYPTLSVLVVFGVIRRAGEYAVTKPAREILFTIVPFNEKYRAKNAIDTFIYRGGDAISGWIFEGLKMVGLGVAGVAFFAAPLAFFWGILGLTLGKYQKSLREKNAEQKT